MGFRKEDAGKEDAAGGANDRGALKPCEANPPLKCGAENPAPEDAIPPACPPRWAFALPV